MIFCADSVNEVVLEKVLRIAKSIGYIPPLDYSDLMLKESAENLQMVMFSEISDLVGKLIRQQSDELPKNRDHVIDIVKETEAMAFMQLITSLSVLSTVYSKKLLRDRVNDLLDTYRDMDHIASGIMTGMSSDAIKRVSDETGEDRNVLMQIISRKIWPDRCMNLSPEEEAVFARMKETKH